MNHTSFILFGTFASFALGFWGLVLVPNRQVGSAGFVVVEATGERYPVPRPGSAQQGADVYRSLGCAECHTQQVRPRGQGSDYARHWGDRRTVALDYLYDSPVQLGSFRLGPDLSNIGNRQTNALWHLAHLYNPRITVPGSIMPRYPFLFEASPLSPGEPLQPGALAEYLGQPISPGQQLIPRPEARALLAYLLSLKAETPVFEAPIPVPPTNAPVANAAPGSP